MPYGSRHYALLLARSGHWDDSEEKSICSLIAIQTSVTKILGGFACMLVRSETDLTAFVDCVGELALCFTNPDDSMLSAFERQQGQVHIGLMLMRDLIARRK